MSTDLRPRIAIAVGDPSGIGPEIALKAALDPHVRTWCRPLLVGDPGVLHAHAERCGIAARMGEVARAADAAWDDSDAIPLFARRQLAPGELRIGQVTAAHGRAALDSARAAIGAAMAAEVDAVVAAPHNETAIREAGIAFDGYPSFVARVTGRAPEDAFLMLCFEAAGREIRIVHVTLHVSVRRALELVTRERIGAAIAAASVALARIGIEHPRIAVSGLNPHAGEGGLFGSDEADVIAPAITAAAAAGIAAEGPYGADTMFAKQGCDAYVVMLHDQGHIVAKTQAPNRTAGLTIGTPVLFSSVAHGSAHDIAGRGMADPSAMIEAIRRLAGAAARDR